MTIICFSLYGSNNFWKYNENNVKVNNIINNNNKNNNKYHYYYYYWSNQTWCITVTTVFFFSHYGPIFQNKKICENKEKKMSKSNKNNNNVYKIIYLEMYLFKYYLSIQCIYYKLLLC